MVPIALLAAAPAVGAAATETAGRASVEQAPPVPAPDPDQALLDLQKCLSDLEGAVDALAPAPAPAPAAAEQQPVPEVPDPATLAETCESILSAVQGAAPPAPPAPAAEPQEPVG